MRLIPRLLETYEEARLLLEVKGWGVAKAADHLAEMEELAPFNISQATLSRKTIPGSKFPIEPEVATAIEGLETRIGYERQADIVTRGLLALHGDPPIVDVDRLARDLREHLPASELMPKFVQALEGKASARATRGLFERLGRVSWKQIAISAGSGALVGCFALLMAPLLPGRANAAAQPGPPMVIVSGPGADYSTVWLRFEPESVLAAVAWGEKMPPEQQVPRFTLPGQKVAPCDAEAGEVDIHGNCWANMGDVKPPCGRRTFRHGDKCYRPVAPDPKKPVGPTP
ncbi:MAG TPA: hypothetical protein VFA20_28840 [Myxococcaceae bacterium]|nr:hypothetical protein [Myxococcaceae bacterium]